jgi:UDP-N-acetylmuramoyl-L-alanyl-D-glutamate--2,6-diaminopimelate ligase
LAFEIIVDYAHTPDALEKVLTTISDVWYNRIITIFGATGDRDRTKRPIMWEIVSKYSDMVILTQDDDYTEKTENIIKDVLPGINREEWEKFYIIPTRKEAIEVWIATARVWDVLLIAGKWDEHLMMTNAWPIKWHDKSVIKEILKKIDDNVIIE